MILETTSTAFDEVTNDGGSLVLKGWDNKDVKQELRELIEEHFDYQKKLLVQVFEEKKMAYSFPRFHDEQDARDEGFNYWIIYKNIWKKGLGKCTLYKFTLSDISGSTTTGGKNGN